MIELGKRSDFALESSQRFSVRRQPRIKDFESHAPIGMKLLGFVDLAHASFAKEPDDLEIVEALAGLKHGAANQNEKGIGKKDASENNIATGASQSGTGRIAVGVHCRRPSWGLGRTVPIVAIEAAAPAIAFLGIPVAIAVRFTYNSP